MITCTNVISVFGLLIIRATDNNELLEELYLPPPLVPPEFG